MASRFPKPRSRYSLSEAIMSTNRTGITSNNGGGVVPYSTDTIRPHEERKSIQFIDFPTNYEEIVKFINGKHSPEDNTDFPVDDLFTITEIIIKHATDDSMVNDILKETNAPYEKVPSINDGFVSPLCILKSICCEISTCKDKACSGEEISIRTKREVIFDKLKPYPWEAKAVLALAAFALEYGDFWHLAQLYGQCNQLTNSVAILKRVPVLINQATLKERQGQVLELNGLIKDTLEVTRLICKVEGLYILNRTEDLPTLQTAVDDIPIYVFWIITAIVACAAKVTHLTSDEKKPYPLSDVVKEIGRIREILDELHGRCVEELEVAKNYKKLLRKMKDAQRTREITEVIKTLILFKDGKLPVISEGNSNEEVKFETFADLVKENSVLFYISSLEKIIEADIADLIKVYDEIQKSNSRWRIVWIPIVEEGTKNQTEKFEKWGSKMPWYKVQFFSSTVIKYLKEEWSYTGNAMSLVMDSEGQRECPNALTLIRNYKDKFFHILLQLPLISIFATMKNKTLENVSKDDTKCIFLCGGMDESHFDDLKKKVMDASDTIKDFGVSIELFRLESLEGNEAKAGEQPKYSADHESFWSGIKCLLDNYIHRVECKTVTKELCKLLSYKNHGEWVMVSQGYKLITSGRTVTISMALGYMSQWKQQNLVLTKFEFGDYFLQEHKKAITVYLADNKDHHDPDCCKFDISVGNIPKNMDCPVCDRSMERIFIISYKCCHGATATSH